MKIQSSGKPEGQGSGSDPADGLLPASASPLDLAFNLLLQLATVSPPPEAVSSNQTDAANALAINQAQSTQSTILLDMQRMLPNSVEKKPLSSSLGELSSQIENNQVLSSSVSMSTMLELGRLPLAALGMPAEDAMLMQQAIQTAPPSSLTMPLSSDAPPMPSAVVSHAASEEEETTAPLAPQTKTVPVHDALSMRSPMPLMDRDGHSHIQTAQPNLSPSLMDLVPEEVVEQYAVHRPTVSATPVVKQPIAFREGSQAQDPVQLFNGLGQMLNNLTTRFVAPTEQSADFFSQQTLLERNGTPQDDLQLEMIRPAVLNAAAKEGYEAKIKMYPPALGEVLAKLRLDHNQANLVLVAENHQVKQIIESHLPLLKQHFQDQNIQLNQVEVHMTSVGEQGERGDAQSFRGSSQGDARIEKGQSAASLEQKDHKSKDSSIIDTYA